MKLSILDRKTHKEYESYPIEILPVAEEDGLHLHLAYEDKDLKSIDNEVGDFVQGVINMMGSLTLVELRLPKECKVQIH